MWKLIRLFSFLLLSVYLSSGSPITEKISLQVKVVGKIKEDKPKLIPPDKLNLYDELPYLDLSYRILEPPKTLETPQIVVPKEGSACGEPKDRSHYRAGIKLFLERKLKEAEHKFLDVLSVQNSAFIPQSQYFLGLIYSKTRREKEALELLRSSCEAPHPYSGPACEALYALIFRVEGKPYPVEHPTLWRAVYRIGIGEEVKALSCTDTVFKNYCSYVTDFIEGRINETYRESTALKRAILLIGEGIYGEAKDLLKPLSKPLGKYRNVALYYLGVIALLEGRKKEAYRVASLLELSDMELAKSLHILLSGQDVVLSRIAFSVTRSEEALKNSGVLYYNRGDYPMAYIQFTKAEEPMLAMYSAIKMGDYKRACNSLKKVKEKDENYYLWLLEILYWLDRKEEMEKVLNEIKDKYPDIYEEYAGWLAFKKEDWARAYRHFKDPYHKALALYNSGDYRRVLELLKDEEGLKERILKAKSAISLGDGELARKFLREESPEEIYLLGMSYFIEGNYSKALELFRKIEDSPLRSKALLRTADSYYNLGQYKQARELYKTLLKEFPDSPEATEATLALAQIELQNPSEDLQALLEEFMRRFPNSPLIPDLKYQLASIYAKEGKKEEAISLLEELKKTDTLKAKALIKLAQMEEDPQIKEEMLREAIATGGKEEKERAIGMLMSMYVENKEFEKLADFLVQGDFDDRKKALELYLSENIKKAVKLYDELIKENPHDEELLSTALKLYRKTGNRKYLFIARRSQNPRVRARALYLLGLTEKKRDKKKALEYFIEVVLTSKGIQPYYNRSIVEASYILASLKAKRDASCLLEKLEPRFLSKKDIERVKILRSKLPKCEVKK